MSLSTATRRWFSRLAMFLAGLGFSARSLAAEAPATVPPSAAEFAAELTAESIAKLIAQLDADAFTEREEAMRQLRKLGSAAVEPLNAALKTATSAEVQTRIRVLLGELASPQWSVDLPAAQARAKREEKLVMIFATLGRLEGTCADAAGQMIAGTFVDPKVCAAINQSMLPVWVRADAVAKLDRLKMLGRARDDRGLPRGDASSKIATFFCAPDGQIVHFVQGYVPAEIMLMEVKLAERQYELVRKSPEKRVAEVVDAALLAQIDAWKKERDALVKEHAAELDRPAEASPRRHRFNELQWRIASLAAGRQAVGHPWETIFAIKTQPGIPRGPYLPPTPE